MIIVLSIYVLCANTSSKHEEYILETIPEWARFSQGRPKKKAKKHVTSTQKIGPAKERKEGQEKRKKKGGDKAKTKTRVNTVVWSKFSVRKHYLVKTAEKYKYIFHYLMTKTAESERSS